MARGVFVGDYEAPPRIDRGVDLQVTRSGHLRAPDLDILAGQQAEIVVGIGALAWVVRIDQIALDHDPLGRVDQHFAVHRALDTQRGMAGGDDMSGRAQTLAVLGAVDAELAPAVTAVGIKGDARVMRKRLATPRLGGRRGEAARQRNMPGMGRKAAAEDLLLGPVALGIPYRIAARSAA